MFAVFQIVTRDNWSQIMYNLMNSGSPFFAVLFCTSLIVFGSFFLLNLVLAVIMQAFVNIQDAKLSTESPRTPEVEEQESPSPQEKVLDKSKIV